MSKLEFKLGAKFWFVPAADYHGKARTLTVTRVGRKWATLKGDSWQEYRAELATGRMDFCSAHCAPGSLYVSREEYDRGVALASAWSALCSRLSGSYGWGVSRPAHVTLETIVQVRKLLWPGEP